MRTLTGDEMLVVYGGGSRCDRKDHSKSRSKHCDDKSRSKHKPSKDRCDGGYKPPRCR